MTPIKAVENRSPNLISLLQDHLLTLMASVESKASGHMYQDTQRRMIIFCLLTLGSNQKVKIVPGLYHPLTWNQEMKVSGQKTSLPLEANFPQCPQDLGTLWTFSPRFFPVTGAAGWKVSYSCAEGMWFKPLNRF